jgi:hypothetical protein
MNLVGAWARDLVYVTSELPEGYKELMPYFREGEDDDILAIQRIKKAKNV